MRTTKLSKLLIITGSVLAGIGLTGCNTDRHEQEELPAKPNILIFYADDVGYADVGCYGAQGVETPHLDNLSANGVRFTDAHSAAATCSPSRYSLLTGNYPFRMQVGILPGDAPMLIKPGTPTLPSMLQEQGYKTAVIGKWHLGIGDGKVDWNKEISPGPMEIGFDYNFIIPATNDRVPCVYMENNRIYNADSSNPMEITFTDDARDPNPYGNPSGISHPELVRQKGDNQHSGVIVNGIPRIIKGGQENDALWTQTDFFASFARLSGYDGSEKIPADSEDMLDVILGRSDKGRDILLEEAGTFALRKGLWKYIMPKSGAPESIYFDAIKNIEMGVISKPQLYNLEEDPGEKNNLAQIYPEMEKELHDKILEITKTHK